VTLHDLTFAVAMIWAIGAASLAVALMFAIGNGRIRFDEPRAWVIAMRCAAVLFFWPLAIPLGMLLALHPDRDDE
jgi:hypothetical protein